MAPNRQASTEGMPMAFVHDGPGQAHAVDARLAEEGRG